MDRLNIGIFLLFVTAAAVPAAGQSTLDWPIGEEQPYRLDSGILANPEAFEVIVYEETVLVEDAAWLRLYFDSVELDAGSSIRMTSPFDGEVQELDADGIAMWSNTSAYFNGEAVHLELIAGPETTANRVVLDRVAVHVVEGGARACGVDGCGYCGADDRVPSDEDWAGRLLPVGCTGSVYNEQSCVVSAGHCAGGYPVIQFRVPDSSYNCNLYNPPVSEQFPITDQSYVNGGVGNDWSVMLTGTNNLGERPYDRYGVYRPIAGTVANPGNPVAVWGFGIDDSPSPTRNMTQQTSSGTIATRYSTYYLFYVDITYGNSGSSLIWNDQIIGIVTHCPCPNVATRVDRSNFADARDNLCPGNPDEDPPLPNPMAFLVPPYGVNSSLIRMEARPAEDELSPPVEYQFDFRYGGEGGSDSDWQSETMYADGGLEPNTQYIYRVRARDSASPPNETDYSPNATGTTFAEVPGAPALSNPTSSTMDVDVDPAGNPSVTDFAVRCLLSLPYDPAWDGKYVAADGSPSGTEVWQTDAEWGTTTVQGLQPATLYFFNVKARNLDGIETAFGPDNSLPTSEEDCSLFGDVNQDGEVAGDDISGFVRAKLGQPPEPGENQACADHGGTLEEDVADFVAVLIN